MSRSKRIRSLSRIAGTVLKHAFLIIMSIISIYPVLWVITLALSPGESLVTPNFVLGFIPVPVTPTLAHFIAIPKLHLLAGANFPVWAKNSIIITSSSVALSVALTLPAGYAFSRKRFRGQQASMFSFLLPSMFPGVITIIPQFLLFSTLGLVDTYFGCIIPYAVGSLSLSVFIMKGAFDSIPRDLDEAASLDGAGEMRTFYKILLPLTLPSIATVALWAFMGSWLDWALANVMLKDNTLWTLPLALYDFIQPNFTYYGSFAALSIIMSIPVFIVFMIFQKYLVTGLTAGSVKG
ncbi:MAG TPA: ABC transporter permease subunit [Nitrososphaerales archaeon]|nr:ABC transporter permease subunit [Nitrososphaerales archaeon]